MKDEKQVVKREETSPATVIQFAMKQGASIDQLEKLLTLQERYDSNEAKKAYNVAMAAFKANPPKIEKDKTVKYKDVKYNHASLYNVTAKISSELSKHGLSASWSTKQNGAILVTCKVTHIKGHSEETTLSAPADQSGSKNAIQAIGSTITYLERYTLLALTGLATVGQDDDGGTAEPVERINEKELSELIDLMTEAKPDREKFLKFFKAESIEAFPKNKFKQAKNALVERAKVKK